MKKSSLLISLILIMILAISAVSAADDVTSDVGETQVVDEVSTPVDEPVATGDAGVLKSSPDSEVLTAPGDKNFTQLQQEIDYSPYGMINLGSNYVRQEGENDIVINKNFNIFGNDQYTIDANGLGGIFKVNEGVTLLLQNVVLVNGNANNGGAIYNEGTVAIISSQISDSKATDGGAVYNKGVLSISGSTLDGNTAIEHGGAVYNIGTAIINDGSLFERNEVTKKGGAYGGAAVFNAYGADKLEISGSDFIDNIALWSGSVGAVASWATGNVKIKDSYFAGNVARWGGAVEFENLNQEEEAIDNCNFYNNTGYQGGAVCINDGARYVKIIDSTFDENIYKGPAGAPTTGANGAAISVGLNVPVTLEIANSIIKNNKGDNSEHSAGVGIRLADYATGIITNCTFENNGNGHGSAINIGTIKNSTGGLTVKDSTFINSIADENIMLFINPNIEASIENCTFENNGNNYTIDNQGTLALKENTIQGVVINKGTITTPINVEVLDNETVTTTEGNVDLHATVTDDNGNALKDLSFKFEIDGEQIDATYDEVNKIYTATYALSTPGIYTVTVVSTKGEEYTVKNGTVKNYRGTFTDLNSKIEAAIAASTVLELGYNFTYTPDFDYDEGMADGIKINEGSLTINGNGYTINANNNNIGPILQMENSACVTLNNISFINSDYGAISNYAELTLNDCIFKDNDAGGSYGAAIYNGGELYVNGCTFENNTCELQGAAIYTWGELTVTDSVFKNNKVTAGTGYAPGESTNGGAAIYIDSLSTLTHITGSNFTNNTAPHDVGVFSAGGAIYVDEAKNVLIEDCRFEENSAVYGGAVMFEKFDQDTVVVKDSVFNNNQAWQGGAINGNELVGSLIITGSNFTANKAVEPNAGDASPKGGAISIGTKSTSGVVLEISECNFNENTAVFTGGAISIAENNEAVVTDSNFTANKAKIGGAIYNYQSDLYVDGSNFEDNAADWYGGAIFGDSSDNEISDSTFTNNGDWYGAAIYSMGANLDLSNNKIISEKAGIFNNGGTFESTVYVKILEGQDTPVYCGNDVVINATVTDDNGNVIRDDTLKFLIYVDDALIGETAADYDPSDKDYKATYTLPDLGEFNVSIMSSQYDTLDVNIGKLINVQGTYTDLQAKIDTANGELVLPYNFTYNEAIDGANFPQGIVINSPVTIDGNGYTISGNNQYRIFDVASGGALTLNNVTLTEGKGSFYNGGYSGGAIRMGLNTNLTVKDSKFVNNTVDFGGAIYSTANNVNIKISDSEFINNTATFQAGAIMASGDGTNVTITGSNFTSNKASEWEAGALYIQDVNSFKADNCNFINNTAPSGAAIDITKYGGSDFEVTISSCNFTDNSAKAVYNWYNGNAVKIEGSTFTNNGAETDYAVYSKGALDLAGNTISNLIYSKGTLTSDVYSVVLGNKTYETAEDTYVLNATLTDDMGNKIYDPNLKFKVNDDVVAFTSFDKATGVYTYSAYPITFESQYLVNVTSESQNINAKYGIIKNLKAGTYTDLAAKIADAIANNEGVLDLPYDFEYTEAIDGDNFPQGIVINSPVIINGNGYTISGNNQYRIFDVASGGDLTLNNVTLTEGKGSFYNGGYSGGAIRMGLNTNLTVKDSKFINNTVDFGGAIYSTANNVNIKISDSEFINNTATLQAGAIMALGDGTKVTITGSNFTSNKASEWEAGALYIQDVNSFKADNCNFINNTAPSGAAIDICKYSGSDFEAIISSCNFTDNSGKAVLNYKNGDVTISDSTFTNNGGETDYAIRNTGTLSLSGNVIDNSIYNRGTITSTTNVTVLGNKTVNAKYGQTVILNATYTDDNGNSIYDPNLAFTVEGDEDLIPATYADGLYTAEYKISMMGEKAVTARLPYDVDTYNGLLDIGPATVILTIDANESIMRKQNETITIKLVDEFGNLLNLSLPVVVQNSAEEDVFSDTITTQNGTYTFNLTGLGVDTYTITAIFMNDNYVPNPKIVSKPFEVTPLEINGTYTDLQKQIDETLENGVLILPYDFAYNDFVDEDFFPYGVIINKNITIDGNGSTISGSNVYRIFNITTGNVVFNNITFVDGIADNGGAIYANSTEDITVTILNSTFANNTATIGGGAVAFMSDDDSKVTYYIIDSLFENNTASGTYKEDESVAGGAIYSEGITDWCYIGFTTFKNNKAIEGNMPNGGAVKVQFGGQLVVLNSTFEDNFAEQAGGAISVQSNTNMNCTVIVLNTKFENNKAGQAGAAVSAIETSGNSLVVIINSTLENNVADITAHAVYVSPRSSVAVINTTLTGNGGATDYGIYNLGKLALINNTVSNIIYTNSAYGEGIITTDTYARILENQTIDITSDRYTLVTTLTDDNGNKIYDRNLEFTINGVPIDAVPAYDKESGLYTYVFEIGSERIYVVNVTSDNEKKLNTEVGILRYIKGTYTDLQAQIDATPEGETLGLTYNFKYTEAIDGANFPSGVVVNKSINIAGPISNDGLISIDGANAYRMLYIKANNVNITGIQFQNGSAVGKFGGAIYVHGAAENVTINNAIFFNNTALNGGAIYFGGDKGIVNSSMFVYNNATASGGAIFWFGDDGLITGEVNEYGPESVFVYNTAGDNGGAVAWFTQGTVGGHNGVIEYTGFGYNNATLNGGAVYWESPDGTIRNSEFNHNHADANGGAVFWNGENGNIYNALFVYNTISGALGGAVFSQGKDLTITDVIFYHNEAANGAAVALFADAKVIDSKFGENVAAGYAGAIYGNANVNITGSEFKDNSAVIGDAIYMNAGELYLENNEINTEVADVVLTNNAVIVSYVNATIIGNATIDTTEFTVNLNATVVDDEGNLIEAPNFKFVINEEEIDATYNPATKLYEAEYTLPGVGVYPVDMTYTETENLDTYIGIIRNVKGTYTDLQNLINDADGELILPYDFIYTKEIDGEKFPEGVLIESPIVIEGNGYTISGNNSYRIFRITADTTINNVTFTNGSAVEFGGAIYTTADLTVSNSTFVNNSVALNDANGGAIAAIADGSEITLNVNNVLFENNCVDNAGGAIAVATMDSKVNYNIYDSEFVDNYAYEAIAASGGAIFSYGNTEGLINNTVFRRNYIDCEDLSNGGAIKLQFGGKLTVANSTFEDNEAEYTGSAISVQADDGKNNVLIVDNCTFTGNSASYGDTITSKQYAGESVVIIKGSTFDSGIFLDELTKASISNSTIENEGYHGIYNLGLLILDKNVVDIIYNNGTILSSVNATLLGNETVPAELYDEVYPFATLTDDNGNPIYDPNFRITVNDVVIEDVEYDYGENVYVSNYTIEKPGDYVVSTLYAADIYTGIYQVPKANITRFEVIPGGQDNRIPYGENVTVYVVLEGVDGEGLNETFNVIVNNAEYSVTVTNGSGSFNVSGLAPGQYAALGIFPGNDCYNKAYATGVFSVLEPEAKLTIEIEDITVGDYLIVKVNFTDADGNPIYGAIEVIISNATYNETFGVITYGNNTIRITGLPVGKYNATAVFVGDEKYGAVNNNTTFEVKQITDYDMTVIPPTETPYGQTVKIEVELPEDATGNVTVTINGTLYNATVENGGATIEIDGLEVGDYTDLEVIYSGDENYVGRSETVEVYVGRADSGLDAWFDEAFISYRENSTIIISIDEGATGTIAIYYDDGDVLLGNFTVEEALDGIEVTNLTAGDHWFYVVYSGDDHFEDTTCYDVGITVEKIDPELDIDATGNKTAGSEITITFTTPEDVDGVVSIFVDGEPVPFTGENGTYTVTLNNLSAGNHVVMGVLEEDTNYNDYSIGGILEISKADPTIGISVDPSEVVTGGSVTVTVTIDEDATGYVLADVNGMSFFGIPEDGKFTFYIDGLEAMTYDIVVTYVGDDKYNNGTATANFTVGKEASAVEAVVPASIDEGEDAAITVTVIPGDATGTVTVYVDGEEYGTYDIGNDISISGLENGTHTIGVKYNGDDNYNASELMEYPITVRYLLTEEDVTRYGSINTYGYNSSVVIVFDFDDVTGNITLVYYDLDQDEYFYYNGTVENGQGIIWLPVFDVGSYGEFPLIYYGNDKYTGLTTTVGFDVVPYETVMDVTPSEDNKVGDIANVTVTVATKEPIDPEIVVPNLTGTVDVYVDGILVAEGAELIDGTVIVPVEGLAAGNHTVAVYYSGDKIYDVCEANTTLEVSKADPTIGISVDPSEVVTGGSVTVTVTIDEDATGYVLADVNGMSFFGLPEDGTFTFDIDGLEAMTYDIVVTYVGDDKYSNGTATASFTVGKAASSVEIISVANATYPDDVIVIFEVVNATDITVVISKDGAPVEATVVVSEEIDTVTICGLATGVYTINITNVGDDNYDESSATALFNVSQATPVISVSAADVTYPGDVVVTVTSDASGTVTVTVGDKSVTDTVEAGVAKDFIISGLDANEEGYAITVGLAESENYTAGVNDTEKVKVMKAASSVVIDDIVDVTYNASVEVTYTVENETEISVVVKDANGTEITTGVNTTTAGKVIISGLNAGEYTIAISNAASDNYAESSDVAKFNVNKAVITIDPEATGDMLVDSEINVTFTVPKDIDGMLDVTIDGNPVLAFIVINGTCTIPGTYEAGLHTVVVTLTGDTNYEDAIGQTTFNVTKVDPTIGISVDSSEVVPGGSVTVTVTIDEDATGYVLADVNGMSFFGIPEDGTFTFDIDDLQAIEYEIDVTYVGDDKYNKGTSSYNFTVRKATSDIEANLPGEAYVGDFVVVEVTVDPAAATGNYSVFIDGVDVSEQFGDLSITNGKGSFVITALTNGTHTIGVRYNGDSNYEPSGIVEYEIEVSKVDVSDDIEIEGSVITYGENATVILSGLPEDATGTVTVTIGDDSYTADVEDGIAIVEIPGLDVGLYELLLVEYSGDNKYEDAKGMATIEVTPAFIDWGLADIPEEIEVNDTVTIVLDWTDPEDASGKLNITLNDEYYGEYTFDEARDGIIIDKFTKPGEYIIVVSAVDNPNYEYAEPLEMRVNVATIDPEMEVTVPEDAKVDEVVNVDVTLPEDATGDVTVIVDGKEVDTVPLVDGAVSIPVEGLAAGNHTVVVIYSGDDQYSPVVSDNINLTVSKVDPTIIIKVDNITVGDNATVTVTVPDDATGYVLIEVGGKQQFGEVKDGKATITVSDLPAGNYTVTAILTSDDKYTEGRNTTSLKVNKVEDYDVEINSTSPREGDNATVTVTVPEDATGNVTVTDKDGNNYTAPVKDGTATVEVPNLPEGDNEVTVTYSGDDKYDGKTTSANITVRSPIRSTTLYADVLVKYEGEAAKYNVTLIDEDGFAVAGMPINMTIVGKTYHGRTDENGIAYLPINLKPGIYNITAEFGGEGNYTAAEPLTTEVHVLTKVRLDQNKDLVKDYGDADKFTVRALDEYGRPIAGEVVNITICGKTYHCKSNADGIASLAINLRPGSYDVTCDYAGYSVSNTVTVKQVLSAPDKQYKKASKYSYTATLKHSNGAAISGKTVTFTLKGQTYTATTNAKGEATISITQALSAGSYKIAVKYIDSTITKTITIK